MNKITNLIKLTYKETKRSSLLVYLILRGLVIVCMISQLLHGDIQNALLCLFSLILLLIPIIIQRKYEVTLPNALETTIYLFIFSAEILGEINNFYHLIPYWDTILHTLNGFLATAVGLSLIDLLNKNSKKFNLSPIYLCLVAFSFSMTIGVLWEFFEYGADNFFMFDMQKDEMVTEISTVTLDEAHSNNVVIIDDISKTILYNEQGEPITVIEGGYLDIGLKDTMKDLFVNFVGTIVFSVFGYFYLKEETRKDNHFIKNFVPIKGKRKLPKTVEKELMKLKQKSNSI